MLVNKIQSRMKIHGNGKAEQLNTIMHMIVASATDAQDEKAECTKYYMRCINVFIISWITNMNIF